MNNWLRFFSPCLYRRLLVLSEGFYVLNIVKHILATSLSHVNIE